MISLSARIRDLTPSATKAMSERAAALCAAGRRVIALSQGELDFDTPVRIRDAGIEAINTGRTRYTKVAGVDPLRRAIVEKFRRDNGLDFGLDQITVGAGAKQVLFNALLATTDPGDEVVFPTPAWVSYPEMARIVGATPIPVACGPETGFKLTPAALEAALSPRTKWLMLNSPGNPTGAVYSVSELRALACVLARRPGVMVMSDDVYETMTYGAPFATMAQAAPEIACRTLTVNSVSKSHAMTGWRVGFGAGPAVLIRAMNAIQGHSTSHASSVSQYAAAEALSGDQDDARLFCDKLRKRRDMMLDWIGRADGLSCVAPDGAFYLFVSCGDLLGARRPDGQAIRTDEDFAAYLLEYFGVAVVPGAAFMAPGYIRISFAASEEDLHEACRRIIAACASLTPAAREAALS